MIGVSKARGRWQAHIWLSQKATGGVAGSKVRACAALHLARCFFLRLRAILTNFLDLNKEYVILSLGVHNLMLIVSMQGRQEHVGTFHTEEEACLAHDIVQLFVYRHVYNCQGDAPRLNHPELRVS